MIFLSEEIVSECDFLLRNVILEDTSYYIRNYYMPYCRFAPYGIGMALGVYLHDTKGKPVKLAWVSVYWNGLLIF